MIEEWEFFFRKAPVKILLSLKNGKKYLSEISREGILSYSQTHKLVDMFCDWGLVELQRNGRVVEVSLTPFGVEIVKEIDEIISKLKEVEKRGEERRELQLQEGIGESDK